jgi:hypothetical protein
LRKASDLAQRPVQSFNCVDRIDHLADARGKREERCGVPARDRDQIDPRQSFRPHLAGDQGMIAWSARSPSSRSAMGLGSLRRHVKQLTTNGKTLAPQEFVMQ